MKLKELEIYDHLYRDIESRINSIKNKKNRYQILYRITKVIVFLSGGTITVLTGWKYGEVDAAKLDNIILVISASIAILAAIEGLFNFKDKGKSYDIFLFDLRRLRDLMCFVYVKGKEEYDKQRDEFFAKYQEILQSQKSIIENSDSGEE